MTFGGSKKWASCIWGLSLLLCQATLSMTVESSEGEEGSQPPQYGLRLSEIGSWPGRAVEAWKYDNPNLRWKAFLRWENEGGWLAIDKQAHFASCYSGVLTGEILGMSRVSNVVIVSSAALLNELIEWKLGFWIHPKYRGISIEDLVIDTAGILIGLLVVEQFCERD